MKKMARKLFVAYDTRTFENLPIANDRIEIMVYNLTGSETGIDSVTTDTTARDTQSDSSYNLQGQKVDDSYHGIIIKNGKKIVKR